MPPLPLLQAPNVFQIGTSQFPPWAIVLVILIIGGLVTAGIVVNRRNPRTPATPEQQRKYMHRTFSRTAKEMGLNREQTALLEKLVTVCKVKQPLLVFSSPSLLDDVLKRGVYALENTGASEEKKQEQLRNIYLTKQLIENSGRRSGVQNTLSLKSGLALTVTPEGGTLRFRVKLVANTRETLAASTPRDRTGNEQRWPKGTRCVVGFSRESDAGYTFPTKVVGYSTIRGESCMLLQHAKTLRQDQQRKSRRKELSRPCFVYPVKITESGSGRKAERKAVVLQHQKIIGTVSDISAGGCAIRAREPLKKATLVKVEMSLSRRDTVVAYGKVQRVREERQGGVMHIMFTRLTGNAMNRIYSFVYDYTAIG